VDNGGTTITYRHESKATSKILVKLATVQVVPFI